MRVTAAMLYAIAPGADGKIVDAIIANAERMNAVSDPTDLAWFLGQSAAETGGFTQLEENLYYTSTKRLRQVWPTRFKSDSAALPYVRNPKALANLVYGERYGNRPATNDGYDYRGSSMFMTTFRDNYAAVQARSKIECVDHPDLLRSFPGALDAAVSYWLDHNLTRFSRSGDLIGMTKAIQGGDGGLRDRKVFVDRAVAFVKRPFSSTTPPQTKPRTDWLRKGASGPAVTALQIKLKLAGFYEEGLTDGDFGDGTDNAVREFQKANGLIVDGVVGDKTATILDHWVNNQSIPPASPAQTGSGSVPGVSGLAALFAALVRLFSAFFKKGK